MLTDHWPLLGLRLTTPRLELRLPDEEQLAALAELAAEGVHEPERMPFLVPWTDLPPAERARSVVQHHWLRLGTWTPADWALTLTVLRDGRVIGLQTLAAREFALLRQVSTASWLGLRHQGQGFGTEMRAAVLHLAFAGLQAEEAVSGALEGSHASYAVSAKHGYRPDGVEHHVVRGARVTNRRLRLLRSDWEQHRAVPVTLTGLEPCLPLFGVTGVG
ncbi:N-acetyltransferase [Kitasatospora sp. MMS16-BH015]|uniref:GNAT family N-acetyltransferase n=1 Tax=Kitasatospora sp. MMS16-BH015 TaxID=2018025 RepID=UPI000CA095C2|nr:GNAT family protein [Kitasatospora sp. MMS16-BH015]AUG79317.1 N-acetyltransferase [Kitasatospora sp. MMS16-BH015]